MRRRRRQDAGARRGDEGKGQVFAYDSEKVRLAPIFDRLKRAGAHNVQVVARPSGLEPLAAACDLVLVDAPCTGSGTWRRRPDAKWRLTERQLAVRQKEQSAILDAACRFVKPGGRLVYVTCSVFPSENEHQVAAFLERTPAFRPVEHASLTASLGDLAADAMIVRQPAGVGFTPLRTGTDGFFVAVLERMAGD